MLLDEGLDQGGLGKRTFCHGFSLGVELVADGSRFGERGATKFVAWSGAGLPYRARSCLYRRS